MRKNIRISAARNENIWIRNRKFADANIFSNEWESVSPVGPARWAN
jgi:hypothetical protein